MTACPSTRVLLLLLALASLGTSALVAMSLMGKPGAPAGPDAPVVAPGAARAGQAMVEPGAIDPPILGQVPAFSLLERSGATVDSRTLGGKAWIAMFIFTRCAGACPAMTSRMYSLQESLKPLPEWERTRLVSVTVDPEHDTPPVLAERARISLSDPSHWLWLTGPRAVIWDLSRQGFKLSVEDAANDPAMPIAHSQKFVLVDPRGRIRGYYDGLGEDEQQIQYERERLIRDLRRVLAEPGPAGSGGEAQP